MSHDTPNYFAQLSAINVTEHVAQKGPFDYLSWPYAVAQLRLFDETATWEIRRFAGLPFLTTDYGTFVEVAVTVRGVTLSQLHPVLDSRNKTLLAPNAFDINTSIQRCLVKAIALHGLGLSVYAGEDLPQVESESSTPSPASPPSPPARPVPVQKLKHPAIPGSGFTHPEPLTPNQLRYIKRLIAETDTDEDQLLGFFGFDALEHIPKAEVNRVIRMLESNREQKVA